MGFIQALCISTGVIVAFIVVMWLRFEFYVRKSRSRLNLQGNTSHLDKHRHTLLAMTRSLKKKRLTVGLDAVMRESGCEPTCHLCGKKLNLGDIFGFVSRVVAGSKETAILRSAKMSSCEECIDSGGRPKRDVDAEIQARLRVADASMDRQQQSRGSHPGCFFDEDGRMF